MKIKIELIERPNPPEMIDLRNVPTNELLYELARREDPIDALIEELRATRNLRLLQDAGYIMTPSTPVTPTTRYIVPETTG